MNENINDCLSKQSDAKTSVSGKLFEECYNGDCNSTVSNAQSNKQTEAAQPPPELPEVIVEIIPNKSDTDFNVTPEEKTGDQPAKAGDPPLAKSDYVMLAYSIHYGQDIGYRLTADLAKGFTDSRVDLKRLNEHLKEYGLKLELTPLLNGLQLTLSKDGTVIDSEVAKTPAARTKGELMSWEERWKDQLKNEDVKDFLARYEHSVKNHTVTEEFLQSLRGLGNKASKDENLANLIKERFKMDGVSIEFKQDSVSLYRSWPVGPSYNHAHSSVHLETSYDGKETACETNTGGPFTIGQNNRGTVSLEKAGKLLFGSEEERPGGYDRELVVDPRDNDTVIQKRVKR